MILHRATLNDIPAILFLERLAESQRYVGQWSEERHRATLAGADARYYVAYEEDGAPAAYVILRGLAETSGSLDLKRIVVAQPGKGLGRQILNEILHIAFDELGAHRLFLDVFDDNARARHLYESLGFQYEGIMRESAERDGVWHDLHLMSMLQSEYAARKTPQ
ncbi:MAG: GNAT family N-acetyltransferase [Acidobacteriota bacterium]|nr:GNAT family N-acetyltransferase [Acidobacteriota bacterium]